MNNKDLIDKILKASNIIKKKSIRSSASYILVGSEISQYLDDLLKNEKIINNRDRKINNLFKKES